MFERSGIMFERGELDLKNPGEICIRGGTMLRVGTM